MQLVLVLISSILWGVTNPFIRKNSAGIEKIQATNTFNRIFLELKFLFTNINYLIPFLLNQFGSIFFYIALGYANLSLVVPITNSLTLLFTTITGIFLGEQVCNLKTFIGLSFVITGISICVSSTSLD
jgi:multidrug transporter EmrE-like cation transporter